MSKQNDETTATYEQIAISYLTQNAEDVTKEIEDARHEMLASQIADLPKDAKIFEIGSGGGQDALFFKSLGYQNIVVSDIANSFLEVLKQKGFSPLKFNLVSDEFPDKYDFIFCWAVLMHLTKEEAKVSLKKIYDALKDGGRLIACVKSSEGKHDEWINFQDNPETKLYFSYWSEGELSDCLDKVGFKTIEIWHYGRWLNVSARK